MAKAHTYHALIRWTGNNGSGTSGYRDYSRAFEAHAEGKPTIEGSADPAYRGDPIRWNPEDLFLASLASCHKLWYLHLCADSGVTVQTYEDHCEGRLEMDSDNVSGRFVEVTLRPSVTISSASDPTLASKLHAEAHAKCFLARSVNFPIHCQPDIQIASL